MQKAIDTGNVQTFYGCFVEKLIMENGRCVGLYARDAATGEYIKCNAAKGVILSTGDYSQNTKMLQHFCPEVIENNIQCLFTNVDVEGSFTNQGDGIQLGMWAGAQVQQSHAPMIHHMGGGADLSGVGVMGNAGFLNLDLNGKRFMNEDLPGQQLENQIELQKNRESWQIFDSNWPQQLFETLLPRIWQIMQEIARRWQQKVDGFYHDPRKTEKMAVIWDGVVHMAKLGIAGGMAVNGVSALHSDILRRDVFRDACGMEPDKFRNVTNGVDHRRWISQINPGLDGLIRDCIGDGYLTHAGHLSDLDRFADDAAVLSRLEQIKGDNKQAFARWAKRQQGVTLNTDAIFNVQVKRLHEYKRQLLNVLHIISLYQQLQDDPNMDFRPQTFLFGAKAAPGYAVAKRIIRLINSLADQINSDPICRDKLQVVFLENYRVSMAEMLMPASEVSQQISTAGKEASGTGNMKFMMNGALTLGTLDGANVEMHQVLGDENMFLFGLTADEAARLRQSYDPHLLYTRDPVLHRVLDQLKTGFRDGVSYEDLYQRLLYGADCPADQYLLLADFASYCAASHRVVDTYADREKWNRMSLHNIARSGIFSADRSIADYADTIWHVPYKK